MEETGCEVICGATTTPLVKRQMIGDLALLFVVLLELYVKLISRTRNNPIAVSFFSCAFFDLAEKIRIFAEIGYA